MGETNGLKTLKPAHEVVALLEARGCCDAEIAEATGYSINHVWRIRAAAPGYALLLSDFKRQIQEKVIDDTADIINIFNSKVPAMAENLERLALDANKEGVRLRATMDWLDRAPAAPKRVQRSENLEERRVIISTRQIENMKAALIDVGAGEVVDLLEGEDFIVDDGQAVVNIDDD